MIHILILMCPILNSFFSKSVSNIETLNDFQISQDHLYANRFRSFTDDDKTKPDPPLDN
eukprot:c36767_g1_i1 orf=311-487(+)